MRCLALQPNGAVEFGVAGLVYDSHSTFTKFILNSIM